MSEFLVEHQVAVSLSVVGAMFVAFLTELRAPVVIALAGACAFLLLGYVDTEDLLGVFSNPAPITIAAMFVLSGALVRTGAVEGIATWVLGRAEERPRTAIAGLLGAAFVGSAFMNNTPLVLVLVPVMLRLARFLERPPTKLLIPLSYAAILGGTCTLIGTSSNLLVDGVARREGLAPFSIFEITPYGLIASAAGLATLAVLGPWLLPARRSAADALSGFGNAFLTDLTVRAGGPFVDKLLKDTAELRRSTIRVLAVLRGGERLRPNDDLVLQARDRLVLQAPAEEVLTLEETDGLEVGGRRWVRSGGNGDEPAEHATVEAFVAPRRAGRELRVADLGLESRFGVRVLGVSRHRHLPGPDLASVRLRAADRLLLQGPAEGIAAIADETDLIAVRAPRARSFRRGRAPLAILAMVAVVVLAALGVMPISALAILAVAAILVLACIDPEEVWQSIDGSVLLLIFAMLAVGRGLENTQAIEAVVAVVQDVLSDTPPFVVLLGLYLLTSVLTEMISNAAVAVLLTPVAIGLGQSLGVEPRTLVLAVMFGASASFATPIGYQTNTLVYGAGNYTFSDFLRIGIPMNLTVGAATCAALAASSWLPQAGGE